MTRRLWSMMRAAMMAAACVGLCGCAGAADTPSSGESGDEPAATSAGQPDLGKCPTEDRIPAEKGDIVVRVVNHASFVLQYADKAIYVDPVGGAKAYRGLPKPTLVVITHAHFDHLDAATLDDLLPAGGQGSQGSQGSQGGKGDVPLVTTKEAAGKLEGAVAGAKVIVLANGEKTEAAGVAIEAVPAYNTSPDRRKFHPKGRDNGYVLRLGGKAIYVAGDTEDTPEMRAMAGIDAAFLPMNKPYTMTIAQAADAVRQFRPKRVYPYHFRNSDKSMADLEAFRRAVGDDAGVNVRLLNWYPQ